MFDIIGMRMAAVIAAILIVVMIVIAAFASLGERAAKQQNKELRADLVTTNQAWGECKATLAQANGEIATQTAQVQAWKDTAARVQKAADVAVAKARQEADQYRKRAARLAQAQPQTADRCEAAAALYVQVVSEDAR